MLPIPSLSFSGGAGGDATAGDTSNTTTVSYGGFNVGGKGSSVAGGTAATSSTPSWLWIAALAVAAILGLLWLAKKRRK